MNHAMRTAIQLLFLESDAALEPITPLDILAAQDQGDGHGGEGGGSGSDADDSSEPDEVEQASDLFSLCPVFPIPFHNYLFSSFSSVMSISLVLSLPILCSVLTPCSSSL